MSLNQRAGLTDPLTYMTRDPCCHVAKTHINKVLNIFHFQLIAQRTIKQHDTEIFSCSVARLSFHVTHFKGIKRRLDLGDKLTSDQII